MTPEAFARERHGDQPRKGTDRLYIVHPEGVARNLARHYPDDADLAAAGWLHDTIEDTATTAEEIEALFGPEVRRLVVGVTKVDGVPWELPTDPETMRLKAADALDNVNESLEALRRGEPVFERFAKGRGKVAYWREIADAVTAMLGDEPIAQELEVAVAETERLAGPSAPD